MDHRADIYSLGVVFYEMLTGELPIGRLETPSQKVQVDVRLDEVVLRTLEKEPRRRYQNASQIKSDLQSISSTRESDFAPTMVHGTREEMSEKVGMPVPAMSLERQETAARLSPEGRVAFRSVVHNGLTVFNDASLFSKRFLGRSFGYNH